MLGILKSGRFGAIAAATALAVTAGGLVSLGTVQEARAIAFATEFAQADTTGEPVEIESARTPTDTVYANPSGTLTREIAVSPVRVRQDGGWTPVDLTLESVDGVIRPKASPFPVELSGGGDDALSRISLSGVTTTMSWVEDLPEPRLDGATATYSDVFDDVDLRMSVTDGGIRQVLVVHNEEAAQNPALDRLQLPTVVEKGSMQSSAKGLSVLDESGREVGGAAAPTMWDSSGDAGAETQQPARSTSPEAIDERTEGPLDGDTVSPVQLEVGDRHVALTPEEDALSGSEVTYPVYVDPSVSPSAYSWAMAFQQHPNSSFYKWTKSNGEGVGYQNYNGVSRKRLFFRFNTEAIRGTQIIGATLRARMTFSSSCAMHATRVYKVGPFSSSLTWNNQPAWRQHLASASQVAFSGCNANGADVSWNVKSGVQETANDRNQSIALGIRQASETNPQAWRRYKHTFRLSIEYNRTPWVPVGTTINNMPCTLTTNPRLGRMTQPPQMRARASDRDSEDTVRSRIGNNGNGEDVSPYGAQPRWVVRNFPVSKAPTDPVPSGEYRFRYRTQDNHGATSNYAEKCKFFVDADLAAVPSLEGEFPDSWSPGQTQQVTVGPGDGNDTVGYAWRVNDDSRPPAKTVNAGSGGQATFTLPQLPAGRHTLRVWAYDAANNPSDAPVERSFEVIDESSIWEFDFDEEQGPSSAADGTQFPVGTAERALRMSFIDTDPSNPTIDRMLALTPQTQTLPALQEQLLDLDASFTVAAYLDPAGTSEDSMTAVSLGEQGTDAVTIEAVSTSEGFEYVFRLRGADGVAREVRADGDDGAPGTMLVLASYNAVFERMELVVANDVQAITSAVLTDAPFVAPALSAPTWTLGAASDGSDRWTGAVDHLSIAQFPVNEMHVNHLIDRGRFADECVQTGAC
ncbi:DNRLRE domain-containing protein [Aeromicrobium sp. CF4.19]|uniref:DNRLRE domain-containing protein n=1 Tax=Aeromicrobium sp. CF4.19 TaxID=3373082 RepID=UPI003EE60ED8